MWVDIMNATNHVNSQTIKKQVKGKLHSAIALMFLILPMVMLVQFSVTFASNAFTAVAESGANAAIAKKTVKSQHATLFKEPVISITFDDGWKSVATNAAPILGEYRIPTTQYVIIDNIGDPEYMNYFQLKALHDAGHEIGSHSMSHIALGKADDTTVLREMQDSKRALIDAKLARDSEINFAYPYGSYSYHTNDLGASIYSSTRNTNGTATLGFDYWDVNVESRFDRTGLIGYTIRNETPMSDIRQAINYAKENNGWLVLTFHQVEDTDSEYAVSKTKFRDILKLVMDENIKTMTVRDAIASREAQ